MEEHINRNICEIVRLCKGYQQAGCATPDMEKMTNISLDLLRKGVVLSLSDSKIRVWNDTIEEIEEILWDEHIDFADEDKGLVQIVGYDLKREQRSKISFYWWSIFIYTYVLVDHDRERRLKFLWCTILFPYIYKLNTCSPITFDEEIKKMLREYPIAEGENAEDETLKILLQYNLDKEFQSVVETIDGISSLLPSKGARDTALRISRSGCLNLYWKYKGQVGDNERK